MRRISFALTTDAVLNRSKDVTRRLGWLFAVPGMRLLAVDKLRKKNARRLAAIEIVSVRRENLDAITVEDCRREGYPFGVGEKATPAGFVASFASAMHVTQDATITRLEFRYLDCDGCGSTPTCVRNDDLVACTPCCGQHEAGTCAPLEARA